MICHTVSAQVGAIEQVVAAVKSGELSQDQIEGSVQRIAALKAKYVSSDIIPTSTSTLEEGVARNAKQMEMAADIYSKSTTLVCSEPGIIPISPSGKKIVFISPGKTPVGGGAVESGEEKTREPYTPDSYIEILKAQCLDITEVRFFSDMKNSAEDENRIDSADIIILATRNATQSTYQYDYGIALGKRLGNKLIVVATCDPYDFLLEKECIKNYITIYEPTVPAFKAAVDVIFGITKALGSLPVGTPATKHLIRDMTTSEEDIKKLWTLWQEIFPKWPIDLPRLTKILHQPHGRHYLHDKGFCMSFLMDGPHGKIAAVGVLPEYRGCGLGTTFVTRAQLDLSRRAEIEGVGSLKSMAFGSVFPRLWCQPPIDLSQDSKDFLLHRGSLRHGKIASILCMDISDFHRLPEIHCPNSSGSISRYHWRCCST
jgi:beta-N-acetylhexosaminidase